MALALREAKRAEGKREVPIGAVLVSGDGSVLARGHNVRETTNDPTTHAEIVAIRKAAKKLKSWRLASATLYVTLEPCLMCMGALLQSRVKRLVYATPDPKAGACGSLYDVSDDRRLNHRLIVTTGVSAEEAGKLLKDFFRKLRNRRGVATKA